jgi:hypothetical protein
VARDKVEVIACDVCHRSKLVHGVEVEPVEVALGEVRKRGDLCEDHDGPVREALKVLPSPAPRRRRRSFEDAVVEEEPAE